MANFLLDAAAFRMSLMNVESTKVGVATEMISNYLQPGSKGLAHNPRSPTLCRKLDSSTLADRSSWRWRDFIVFVEERVTTSSADADTTVAAGLAGQVTANTPPSSFRRQRSLTGSTTMPVIPTEGASGGGGGVPTAEELVRALGAAELAASNALGMRGQPVDDLLACIVNGAFVGSCERGLFDKVDHLVFTCLREKYFAEFQESKDWSTYFQFACISQKKVTESDFALFRVLGRGGFGLVNGCKRNYSGKLYAMKMMNKRRVKLKKAEAFCLNERNILAAIDSPYVVCLKYSFVTQQELYLILDLMTGGDLGYHIQRKGRFSAEETLYYSTRILLGIAALHELNIVYRDLKPENVLMDEAGYTKISDLGLACKMGKTGLSGACGTRGYWAPEMLRKDANGKRERYFLSVDWFSFGCCMFEFMLGLSPFRTERARKWGPHPKVEKSDKDKAIDLAILEMDPEYDPDVFSEDAKSLLQGLLCKNGKERLGAGGVEEIKAHAFFKGVNWDTFPRSTPPSIPAKDINTATQSEIGAFADDRASQKISLVAEDHKHFTNWDFTSLPAFQSEVVEFLQYEEVYVSDTHSAFCVKQSVVSLPPSSLPNFSSSLLSR